MKTSSALDQDLIERMGKYFPKPVEALQELRASGRGVGLGVRVR
jgi:hypothetical protein